MIVNDLQFPFIVTHFQILNITCMLKLDWSLSILYIIIFVNGFESWSRNTLSQSFFIFWFAIHLRNKSIGKVREKILSTYLKEHKFILAIWVIRLMSLPLALRSRALNSEGRWKVKHSSKRGFYEYKCIRIRKFSSRFPYRRIIFNNFKNTPK